MTTALTLDMLAVSVGMPAPLGLWQGEPVVSGIRKSPVTTRTVKVGDVNIDGDGQADLTVHGGEDKAVYAYPADHWQWWKETAKFDAAPASFGENLTLRGATEDAVRIGDIFTWGKVILEISQPRSPCFKFAMLTGRDDMGARMTVAAHTGWYFRVHETGEVATSEPLKRIATDAAAPTVREAFTAVYHPRVPIPLIEKVLNAKPLSEAWRQGILRRLKAAGVI